MIIPHLSTCSIVTVIIWLILYVVSAICNQSVFPVSFIFRCRVGEKVMFQELVHWSNFSKSQFRLLIPVTESANAFSQALQNPPVLKQKVCSILSFLMGQRILTDRNARLQSVKTAITFSTTPKERYQTQN